LIFFNFTHIWLALAMLPVATGTYGAA